MDGLVGRRIVKVRVLTEAEAEDEGWEYGSPPVLELDDGTLLYPSQDEEGNGPGALFGRKGEETFIIFPARGE